MWDELDMILSPLNCVCEAKGKLFKREEQQRLMKFLHGLNGAFEQARSQILLLDPLPNVDRAYAMIIQVEDELSLNNSTQEGHHLMAMNVMESNDDESCQSQAMVAAVRQQGGFKRRLTKEEKRRLRCRHCNGVGHEIDECFKLHGVPEWYKEYNKGRDRQHANYVDCSDDSVSVFGGFEQKTGNQEMTKLIQTEVARYLSSLNSQGNNTQAKGEVNFVQKQRSETNEFDGHYAFSIVSSMERCSWIVDSGASSHVCSNPNLLITSYLLEEPKVRFNLGGRSLSHYMDLFASKQA